MAQIVDHYVAHPHGRYAFEHCADSSVPLSEQACDRFPLDWLWAGDDVASQDATLFSPVTFRELVKPNLVRIFAVGKARNLWTAYHSCGAIRPIIPDLIEIGLDVLNPIQCNATCMDSLELKREFGAHLFRLTHYASPFLIGSSPARRSTPGFWPRRCAAVQNRWNAARSRPSSARE